MHIGRAAEHTSWTELAPGTLPVSMRVFVLQFRCRIRLQQLDSLDRTGAVSAIGLMGLDLVPLKGLPRPPAR